MTKQVLSPHIKVLAERLVTDIRHRGLSVGDRYMTTEEISQTLGVGKASAGKAMRHLAERQILVSRQRSGTFIGPALAARRSSKVSSICVLLPAGDPSGTHWAYQTFIAGIRNKVSNVTVQFGFVPENDPLPYVRELIDASRESGQFAGVVAVSCPPEVYRYLAELHVPAVVSGSLYSDELSLASVDSDNFECGRLLAQYLISREHRHIALLMTGAGRPGDNLFFDGINAALSETDLPRNALTLRLVRNDIMVLRTITKDLLTGENRPTGIITRGSYQAGAIVSVATELGLRVPDDVEIAFDHQDETTPCSDVSSCTRVEPKWSFKDIAAKIGDILQELSQSIPAQPYRVVIPVELHEPMRDQEVSKG